MIDILVNGTTILAIGPFTVSDTEIQASDIIFPKHILATKWQIVSVETVERLTTTSHTYEDGKLVAKLLPSTYPQESAAALNEVRILRERILARINGYGNTLLLKEPPELAEEKANCIILIQGLLDITSIPTVISATNLKELDLAIRTEYARLVNLATPELKKAFRSIDM